MQIKIAWGRTNETQSGCISTYTPRFAQFVFDHDPAVCNDGALPASDADRWRGKEQRLCADAVCSLGSPRFALYRRLFLWRSGIFCRRAARQLRVYLPVFHVQLFFARVSDRHSLHAYCFCFDLYADNDDQASGAGAKRSRSRDGPQQSASRDLTRFAYAVDVDSRRKLCSDGKWR